MVQRASSPDPSKSVWRHLTRPGKGDRIAAGAIEARPLPLAQPEVVYGGWVESSFDLLHGTDVSDKPLSPEVLVELFGEVDEWADPNWADTQVFPHSQS